MRSMPSVESIPSWRPQAGQKGDEEYPTIYPAHIEENPFLSSKPPGIIAMPTSDSPESSLTNGDQCASDYPTHG